MEQLKAEYIKTNDRTEQDESEYYSCSWNCVKQKINKLAKV